MLARASLLTSLQTPVPVSSSQGKTTRLLNSLRCAVYAWRQLACGTNEQHTGALLDEKLNEVARLLRNAPPPVGTDGKGNKVWRWKGEPYGKLGR